jgi:hypothetical protein
MDGCELDVLLQKLKESNLPESEVSKFTAKKKQ